MNEKQQIEAYRKGYTALDEAGPADHQVSATYVAANDPLKLEVQLSDARAFVSLGVDPGKFFCAGLARHLVAYRAEHPDAFVGFIHVPPDLASHPAAAADCPLPTRNQSIALLAWVLGRSVAAIAAHRPGPLVVLLTGFWPFKGVHTNVTEDFLFAESGELRTENLDALMRHAFGTEARGEPLAGPPSCGLRYRVTGREIVLMAGVLSLASTRDESRAGTYDAGMAKVRAQFAALTALCARVAAARPNVVLGLGVDSTQNRLQAGELPRFKIETQTCGFRHGGVTEADFTHEPVALSELAELWLGAERPGLGVPQTQS